MSDESQSRGSIQDVTDPPLKISVSNIGLKKIDAKLPLAVYLARTWGLRRFIALNAHYRAFSGPRATMLGRVWLLLDPFLRILMYWIIFALVLNTQRGTDNFVAFLAIGIIFFSPIPAALSGGSTFINRNQSIMKAFSFPRLTLVLSDSLKEFLDTIPEFIALLIFIWVIPPHVMPSYYWLLIFPLWVLRHIFMLGLSMLSIWLDSFLPDAAKLWPLVTRFWFYGSGVLFDIESYVSDQTLKTIFAINPGHIFIDAARDSLLRHELPSTSTWLQLAGWSFFACALGFILFRRSERKLTLVR